MIVRPCSRGIELLTADDQVLRRQETAGRNGAFVKAETDRRVNPSRETARILARLVMIGPLTAALDRALFSGLTVTCRLDRTPVSGRGRRMSVHEIATVNSSRRRSMGNRTRCFARTVCRTCQLSQP